MRNYDITQVPCHETGEMSHLSIFFQNEKHKNKENRKCESGVISRKVCLDATHQKSRYGYDEEMRHF